jgi:hypothetical protein
MGTDSSIDITRQLKVSVEAHHYWIVVRNFALALASVVIVSLLGRLDGLVALSVACAFFVFLHPREGLWITPTLVMVASLLAPPEGFQWGAGYSPELIYWAIAVCLPFAAMAVRYAWTREESRGGSAIGCRVAPPRAFYGFAIISIFATVVGLLHGYPLQNVLKQFFGCALLCGYFLFALRFAPRQKDIEAVVGSAIAAGIACAAFYECIYLYRLPELGFHKELTILSSYAGGLAVQLLPDFSGSNRDGRPRRALVLSVILLGVPLLAQFKRAIAACLICVALAVGLRSAVRWRRYFYVITAFLLFTAMIGTDLLNPVGAWFSKYPALKDLFPEDVQSHYSVYLRATESSQVIESLGGVPTVGTGLGSTVSWYDPIARTTWEQETLDVGWVYLVVKLGLIGTAAFVWFVCGLGSRAINLIKNPLHLGLLLLLVFQLLQMVADPFFVYFMTACWAGTTCGFLHVLNCDSRELMLAKRAAG